MALTKDYDPKKVTITVGGHEVKGIADGTFLTVNRNNQTWSLASGASGEHARSKSNDRSGTFELTLMQTSETNDFLSGKMVADEATNSGKFLVHVFDANGATLVKTDDAWVQQPPSVEYGKELSDRVWTIESGDITFVTIGGIT